MSTDLLYDQELAAWTEREAGKLRQLQSQRWNGELDLEHLAEEVEDLGRCRRDAVRSQIRRILEHLLKLDHSPAAGPRAGWKHARPKNSIAQSHSGAQGTKLALTMR